VEEILGPHRVEILRLARKHGVRRVRVFGSVARNEATPESDVDLLLEFGRGASTLGRFRLAADLGGLIGRRVDAGVPDGLHWLVRPQVMSEAVDL
jgi:predicted nucleotidyltransferase